MFSDLSIFVYKTARASLFYVKPLKWAKFLLRQLSYLGFPPLGYDKTIKCKKWRPQNIFDPYPIFVAGCFK